MKISRTVSLEFDDLNEIQEKIKKGYHSNLSEFIQSAVKKYLESYDE